MSTSTETLKLVDPESESYSVMARIAGNEPLASIDLDGSEMLDRSKLFLISEARNSLNRIIKLTNFLEKIENTFMNAVNESIENDPTDIQLIASSMEIISKLLEKANAFVMQVLKDDKLQQIIINTTTVITPDGKSATVIDANSRDEIRNIAESLISQLTSSIEESEGEQDVQ